VFLDFICVHLCASVAIKIIPLAIADNSPMNSARRGLLLLVALVLSVAGGIVVLSRTMDPDAFWHLRVAEQLQREGIGPMVDQLSFASIKTPWTP
jgi:hypothetical protein